MTELNYAADAERLAVLKASKDAIEAEMDAIRSKYEDVPEDTYVAGDYILKVWRMHRFDAATASRVLTKAKFESILKAVPNAALAKAILSPTDYAKTLKATAIIVTPQKVTDEE